MNALFKKEQDAPSFAKVISKEGNTLCIVQDRKGRQFNVESDGSYSVGKQVKIKNGVIVAKVKRPAVIPHFNV